LYNPPTSGVNAVLEQASLNAAITAATNTGVGGLFWAVSSNNPAVSTGSTPWNMKTLLQAGSAVKNVSGVALTGLTNNLVVAFGSALITGPNSNYSFVGTAASEVPSATQAIENFDGGLIIPPGSVLALLAATTPVAVSACGFLSWDEVVV
jgi:hypothetical protein